MAGSPGPGRSDQRTELRDALIVVLLAATGPRVSELTGANVEDFYVNDFASFRSTRRQR